MKHFGLIGHPLGHSFSKTYFTEKFEREGLDCEYENYDLEDLTLGPALWTLLKGFNVTIPYKEAILPYLDELDPVAAEVCAVNTVKVLPDGRLIGYNTDVIGLEESLGAMLSRKGCQRKPMTPALVLGTGGASKAVQYVLRKNGIPYHVVSRDPEKGDYIYPMAGASTSSNSGAAPAALTAQVLTPDVVSSHTLIINATPVGMAPHSDAAPAIPYEAITTGHLLFDLIYNPEETLFLMSGRERGAQTMNGLAMLHAQAEASWRIWMASEQSSPR